MGYPPMVIVSGETMGHWSMSSRGYYIKNVTNTQTHRPYCVSDLIALLLRLCR